MVWKYLNFLQLFFLINSLIVVYTQLYVWYDLDSKITSISYMLSEEKCDFKRAFWLNYTESSYYLHLHFIYKVV